MDGHLGWLGLGPPRRSTVVKPRASGRCARKDRPRSAAGQLRRSEDDLVFYVLTMVLGRPDESLHSSRLLGAAILRRANFTRRSGRPAAELCGSTFATWRR